MSDMIRCINCLHAVVGRGEIVRCERGNWRRPYDRPLSAVMVNSHKLRCDRYEYAGDDDAD